ncbi:MAG: hypothetical protein RL172_2172 [Bacteroidota bacterium]|jgi:outer membrane protein
MKQLSTILNIVLLIAVAVLYYLHYKGNDKKVINNPSSNVHIDSCIGAPVIAYVDLDSLNAQVTYIRNKKKELENEQQNIASEYENAYRGMENEKNNFLKRGNAITQAEAEEFQGKLMQKQQQIENSKQSRAQKLAERGAKVMEEMQAKLKAFLNEYNKDKKYTYIFATGTGLDYLFYKDSSRNITSDVIKGLNEMIDKEPK